MASRTAFRDRADAGRQLAVRLRAYQRESPIVLGLPRGGVPVAYEVARELGAALDVCVVRKLGAPMQPELAIGAVAEDGASYVDRDLMDRLGVSDEELAQMARKKRAEVEERVKSLRGNAPRIDVRGRTVIVVDDGVATGSTARAALRTLRTRGASRVVLAVPVAAVQAVDELTPLADELVCLRAEDDLVAVGLWYEDFSATTDEEVKDLLTRARAGGAATRTSVPGRAIEEDVAIPLDTTSHVTVAGHGVRARARHLDGHLAVPASARGLVLFAHGSGSSRLSPRNRYVAAQLAKVGMATLLLDLLTAEEEQVDARTGELRFDIELLASRLVVATDWARRRTALSRLPIGYFGASTGAAAALVAAAERCDVVRAVVSRGGRPDLAEEVLGEVRAPTLLIVGGDDPEVLQLNREAAYLLGGEKRVDVVSGATHLFEEPGTLEQVATAAALWFVDHLGRVAAEATA